MEIGWGVERQEIGGERLPTEGWTMGPSVFVCVVVVVCVHVGQSVSRYECMRALIGERMHACMHALNPHTDASLHKGAEAAKEGQGQGRAGSETGGRCR